MEASSCRYFLAQTNWPKQTGMMASLARAAPCWRGRFGAMEISIALLEITALPRRLPGKSPHGHWDTIDPKRT
jgi:hypothetical protein